MTESRALSARVLMSAPLSEVALFLRDLALPGESGCGWIICGSVWLWVC
jgi:hypothetical protein